MPTSAENAATARANLETALVNATARLAELDAVPLETRARLTYSVGVMSYDWSGYRRAIMDQIKSTKEALLNIQALGGPWNEYGVAR